MPETNTGRGGGDRRVEVKKIGSELVIVEAG